MTRFMPITLHKIVIPRNVMASGCHGFPRGADDEDRCDHRGGMRLTSRSMSTSMPWGRTETEQTQDDGNNCPLSCHGVVSIVMS